MMFYKIKSNWSSQQDASEENSLLDLFYKCNVVFMGEVGGFMQIQNVKAGDFIAIASGQRIVAFAKVTSQPETLKCLIEKYRNDFSQYEIGKKVIEDVEKEKVKGVGFTISEIVTLESNSIEYKQPCTFNLICKEAIIKAINFIQKDNF